MTFLRTFRLAGGLAAGVILLGAAVPATAAAQSTARTTAAQGVASPVRVVKQALDLPAVSCPTANVCEAVGTGLTPSGEGQIAIAVRIVDGRATRVVRIAALHHLSGVFCVTPDSCEAVGTTNPSDNGHGAVVNLWRGRPTGLHVVREASSLNGVTCTSRVTCEAAGQTSTTSTSQGLVVGLLFGKPVLVRVVPGTAALDGLSCHVLTGCEAVGASPTDVGIAVRLGLRSTGPVHQVSGTLFLGGIACTNLVTCVAVGGVYVQQRPTAVLTLIQSGEPGPAQTDPDAAGWSNVACSRGMTCQAVGFSVQPHGGTVTTIQDGRAADTVPVDGAFHLDGISCPTATTCVVTGDNGSEGVFGTVTIR
jgi:hypothetical protein